MAYELTGPYLRAEGARTAHFRRIKAMQHVTESNPITSRRTRWPFVAGALWLSVVSFGLIFVWQHAGRPGIAAVAGATWPGNSRVELSRSGTTLVMFAHPHCPCTRASLAELERIVAQCNGSQSTSKSHVTPWIVFYKPSDASKEWAHTASWSIAEAIPGAHVICDEDGTEAKRFDAKTSGQAFLYNAAGERLFEGGITGSRGHEGDNPGHTAIVQLSRDGKSLCRATPVYGCPIVDEVVSP